VARLEELPTSSVERAGGTEVIQYRGAILPLLRLSHVLNVPPVAEVAPTIQLVVYASNGRQVGLVVDCIVDIVEETIKIERRERRGDLLGSAVLQGRVTDLVDLESLIARTNPYGEAA
jgi:two-component system, chemotaxis family, sensor kinase CheA